jgi:MoaA/NifB/PqqE/SkfB family radical SAM enzyme
LDEGILMRPQEVIRAWGSILTGRRPSLSIEITRECPLRCPGCYAYEESHVAEGVGLRQLQDLRGEALIAGVLRVVDELRPLHLSIVGGDPLVRFRELEVLLPKLEQRGIHVQLVTSAFREIPSAWADIPRLNIVVSVDGLQADHDLRRKPATYSRILKNISGHRVTVHCTITAQMMQRAQYLDDFLAFWAPNPNVKRVWMSFFTPQKGASDAEILSPCERQAAVADLLRLGALHPKLDMPGSVVREFLHPPDSPEDCIFARTTTTISADLKSRIAPCQFGGEPDCSQCGCIASMGLAAVGHHRVAMNVTAGQLFRLSDKVGSAVRSLRNGQQNDARPRESSRERHAQDLVSIQDRNEVA